MTTTTSTPAAPDGEQLVHHAYNEFDMQLPAHWVEVPSTEVDTLNFRSEVEQATITVSAEFLVIPAEKMDAIAAYCVDSRVDALQASRVCKINVLSRSVEPTADGKGRQVLFGLEVPGERIFLYLGYVTEKKVFNFTFSCRPERAVAAALFDKIMPKLRVKLP